jgi:hypothetical protein
MSAITAELMVAHGTPAWFAMVGEVLTEAAIRAALPPGLNVCLVERYTDGAELAPGLLPGVRFEIRAGRPSFRAGALPGERGDITLEVTTAASRTLNTLYGADAAFTAAFSAFLADGQLKIEGDLAALGDWFSGVHDRIVERTRETPARAG